MIELKELVKKVIKDTKRNRLVWEEISDNYLKTKVEIKYPTGLEIAEVGLVRNELVDREVNHTYTMESGGRFIDDAYYKPLKEFGQYLFVDEEWSLFRR